MQEHQKGVQDKPAGGDLRSERCWSSKVKLAQYTFTQFGSPKASFHEELLVFDDLNSQPRKRAALIFICSTSLEIDLSFSVSSVSPP